MINGRHVLTATAASAGAETAAAATAINHARMSHQPSSILFSDDTLCIAFNNGTDAYLY